MIGGVGKEVARKMGLRVTWGGDFKSLYDPAHWELTDWRTVRKPDPVGDRPVRYAAHYIAHGVWPSVQLRSQ